MDETARSAAEGTWWRASSYTIKDGRIVPKSAPAPYDPWREYQDTWSITDPKSAANTDLCQLVDELQLIHTEDELLRGRISTNASTLIVNWCSNYGVLGVLPHRVQSMIFPGSLVRRGRKQIMPQRIVWRTGGRWQLHTEASDFPAGVVLQDHVIGFSKRVDIASLKLLLKAFLPGLTDRRISSGDVPLPVNGKFWREYQEPVKDFYGAASSFALAVRDAGEGRGDPLQALLCNVNPAAVSLKPENRLTLRWSCPSLLASLAVMVLIDHSEGCPPGICKWRRCSKWFPRRRSTREYCGTPHQATAEKDRQRQRARESAPKGSRSGPRG